MFSYYGSKSKIVDYYPLPKFNKIIEPFAGSARYSLKYWYKDIMIVDKYEEVIKCWGYLKNASKKDILNLPDISKMKPGDDLRNLNLSNEEIIFLGFNIAISSLSPRYIITSMAVNQHGIKTYLKRCANNLYKIKNWQIIHDSYENIVNQEATWFIDPPYQFGGHAYKENKINFEDLSKFCKDRKGQVIVCENNQATWLPFKDFINTKGTRKKRQKEVIYSNIVTNYDNIQQKLF